MSVTMGVVIPTFNRANWVVESVQSVLDQSHAADSIVVVDDGSTDDTADALAPFGQRITLFQQTQAGPAAAKNLGVRTLDTTWTIFVDSDDRLERHALKTIKTAIESRPDAALLSFKARETDAAGTPTGAVFGKRSEGTEYSTAGLLRYDAGGCSWFAVRRSAFNSISGFDETLRSAEECDFVLRLSENYQLSAILEPLVLRRQHGGMLSSDRELNARSWIRILERLRDERADWVQDNPHAFSRSWSKEHLRLGRALLAGSKGTEARQVLRIATSHRPFHLRSWIYRTRAILAG